MVAVVEATLNGVERVWQQVNQFRQSMIELNDQTEAISKVVRSLDGIAGEVHLLALNAAIEAAGAGEYGERFRVVAHQIKQLAGRANRATTEAQQLIQQVQLSSRTSLVQVEEGQAEVLAVVQANSGLRSSLCELEQSAEQVAEAVDYLVNLAVKVSQQAEEIQQATQQQRVSSEQVLVSPHAGEIATQTAHTTVQIGRSSVQLELLTN